jgi:hypothetical protein
MFAVVNNFNVVDSSVSKMCNCCLETGCGSTWYDAQLVLVSLSPQGARP